MTTPVLSLPEMSPSQAGKYLTFNEALHQIEGKLVRVASRTTTAEPGTPANGDAYIIPSGATGSNWTGQTNKLAVYYGTAWSIVTPTEGMRVWVNNEDREVVYTGSAWQRRGGVVVQNVATDADITLTTDQNGADLVEITDTGVVLTTARNVIVETRARLIAARNSTAQALTFKTSAGTGISIAAGNGALLWSDGTNVRRLTADQA